jgi:uncharacterized protein
MSVVHENLSCEIIVTNACNMKCSYCIAADMPGPTMGKSTGRKAIEMFVYLAEGGKTIEFTFTGGEPLVAFPALEYLAGYAHERATDAGMRASFVLKTNGSILDSAIIEFLRKYSMKVVLSIDGLAAIHDRHRRTADARGTHSVVHQNLLALLQNDIPCVASLTVHPDSSSAVIDNVRYLYDIGVERIDIGPAYGTVEWTSDSTHMLARSLMDVAGCVRDVHSKGGQLDVGPFYRESEHVGGVLANCWGCHAASTHLAFLPNGQIAGCSALAMMVKRFPDMVLGDVFGGLEQQAVDRMIGLTQAAVEHRPACHECLAANNCTGGCLAINYATTGAPLLPPYLYCNTISIIPKAWQKAWAEDEATRESPGQQIRRKLQLEGALDNHSALLHGHK